VLRSLISLALAVVSLPVVNHTAAQRATNHSGNRERFWPTWRGPQNTGVSTTAKPPTVWSETRNVRWKIELPGRSAASPIVWGSTVYVPTAVPADRAAGARGVHRFLVMAIDRKDGRIVWQRTAKEEAPHEGTHQDFGTMASPSALTDGEHLIASFESRGIFAYDMTGKPVWQKDLGDKRMRNEFGEGSTPALYKDKLFVVWDHQEESFIVALNKRTGEEIWRTRRDEIDSWATPIVVEHDGRAQVVTGAMRGVRAYDAETGKTLWETGGLTMNPIPSPVAAEGYVYLMSGFRGNALKAIRFGEAKGDITGTSAIAWTLDRDTPYVPSPLLYDGILYFLKSNNALISAFEAKTGKPLYQAQRIEGLPSNVFASPVAADGRIYVLGQEGTAVVFKHGPRLEAVATNKLDDRFDASPALVDNEMFLRGYKNLYCIAGD
jgi:outer membrane protein assembly factor BamB